MTISETELAKGLGLHINDHNDPGDDIDTLALARRAAELLGVTLAPKKPEPGTIGITCDGLAAYVDGGGVWRVILANGDWRNANDADAITPARVVSEAEWEYAISLREQRDALRTELGVTVEERNKWRDRAGAFEASLRDLHEAKEQKASPAEPVELSEEEVGEIWDGELLPTHQHDGWDVWRESFNANMVRTVNAALAKHGGARELPSRARVELALIDGLKGTGEDLSYKARQRATEAVMELLGGGDRG